jgi:TolB-like protein
MSLLTELKRRNVFRIGIAYVLMGWVLLQGSDFVLDLIGAPNWVIQVFALLVAIGLPIALFFAWAFEMTPEGIKREHEVDRTQSITSKTGRKLDFTIIGVLALVIVGMVAERLMNDGDEATGETTAIADAATKSIAVLPFDDLSQAQDQGWFADGLAEEILNALTRTPDLHVSSRTASFRYRDSDLPLDQIATELGVEHILEGSVRSSGDRIRVTAQLIRAADSSHVWSENYDRNQADMIAIQEDLAKSIAEALETSMDPAALEAMAQVGTSSVEAYVAYLKGRSLDSGTSTRPREEVLIDIRSQFELAVEVDPEFSEAYFQLASWWINELTPTNIFYNITGLPTAQMLEEFDRVINLAIEHASNDTDRKGYRAAKAEVDGRLRDAIRLYRDYVNDRPNQQIGWQGLVASAMKASDEANSRKAFDWLKENGKRDLNSAITYLAHGYQHDDPSEVADYGLERLDQWPDVPGLAYQVHRAMMWAGRTEEGAALARRMDMEWVNTPLLLIRQACSEGRTEDATAIFDEFNLEEDDNAWLSLKILGRDAEASRAAAPMAESISPFQYSTPLVYRIFDPSPYPAIMELIDREQVLRPPPLEIPFKCPPLEGKSIAVLPFVNMSADPDNEYFSDGVSEEILNVLAGIPNLKVTARTSAFSFKGSNKKVSEIANELGVQHILEGSVRKAGNQVRVTAQLIKAGEDFHLWSQTYDRELDNIFTIQDEIAKSIAEQLKVQLELEPAQENFTGTTNTEAYDAYLRGVAHWHLRTGESLRNSIALFERAIELDPGFARAWAGLALTYAVAVDYMSMPMEESMPKTRQAAERALELNPELVEAATALIYSTDDVNQQLEYARRALDISDAFATTHQWHATTLMILGDLETARQEYEIAVNLDPRSRVIAMNHASVFALMDDWERAEEFAWNLLSFAPDYAAAHTLLFEVMLRKGDQQGAREAGHGVAKILGRDVDRTEEYLALYFDPEQSTSALATIMSWPRDDWWNPSNPSLIHIYNMPTVLAGAGAYDAAIEVMSELVENYSSYTYGTFRSDLSIPGLVCRDDVQQLLATTDLPPLIVPYPCEELLAEEPGAPDP